MNFLKKLYLFVLLSSVFVSPVYSMKRLASGPAGGCVGLAKEPKRPRTEEGYLLSLAKGNYQIFQHILSFLDQTDKDNLVSTCRFFFEKETDFRPDVVFSDFYFEKPSSLNQDDLWRCGYFTLYNAFKILNFLKEGEKSFLSLFRFVSSNLNDQGGFDEFFQRSFNLYGFNFSRLIWLRMLKMLCSLFISEESYPDRSLAYAYIYKKPLWRIQFEDVICKLFEVENVNNITNLSVILLDQFKGPVKITDLVLQNPTLLERKKVFEETKIPQVVVIKRGNHWNVFIVTKIGVIVVDSYFDFNGFTMRYEFCRYAKLLYDFFNDR